MKRNWLTQVFLMSLAACGTGIIGIDGTSRHGTIDDGAPSLSCGDGTCDTSEDCTSCVADCGVCPTTCGDGTCDASEDCTSCAADCGACPAICGDGTCDTSEDCTSCAADCGACPATCGDGTCDPGENNSTCPTDCAPPGNNSVCGNNVCEAAENCSSCAGDCGDCGGNLNDPPGTQYAAQKLVFQDRKTGHEVWRLTTDGAQLGYRHMAPGDQSSESIAFSPDSSTITYCKTYVGGSPPTKPVGVYMMDITSGVETLLAPGPNAYGCNAVFAKNSTREVYYYQQVGAQQKLRAVNVDTYAVRTIVTFDAVFKGAQKITQNLDGSYIGVHPWKQFTDGMKYTFILTPQGTYHPNWSPTSGVTGEDGTLWSPTEPDRVWAIRDGVPGFWNIDTLDFRPAVGNPGHASWHPNGLWYYRRTLYNVETGNTVLGSVVNFSTHPNINPTEASLGVNARIVIDAAKDERELYVMTLDRLSRNRDFRDPTYLLCLMYSTVNPQHLPGLNSSHPHPHWSPNGQYILFTSDTNYLSQGTPLGGTGGDHMTDLFLVPMSLP